MTVALADQVWFTTALAADYSGYHPVTVLRALESGRLRGSQPGSRPGTRWRIHRDDLDAWMRGETPT